ncbi:MAG: nitronate monooxygenase, partial [Thermomicrobiaceae bacterium]|nr:nitronate monooxygenase [Thermomicrobiaceae bacterium]
MTIMRTRVCELLGITYPIIQAGMGSFTSAELVAASSNAGILGSLGGANRPPPVLGEEIARIRARTDRPFAVNFLVTDLPEETFAVALAERVPVISFALADPGGLVERAHDAGALVIHQVHSRRQAAEAVEHGADILIAQGGEAGGFGRFVSTMALVPQVVDEVRPVPVVA